MARLKSHFFYTEKDSKGKNFAISITAKFCYFLHCILQGSDSINIYYMLILYM